MGTVLEQDGFEKMGVNLVARRAGIDKVLIYRYFGSFDGLLSAFGESLGQLLAAGEIIPFVADEKVTRRRPRSGR